MSAPVVSWRDRNNTGELERWNIGIVDAGKDSPEQGVLLWNNYKGVEDISDMQDCVITAVDLEGGIGVEGTPTHKLINEQWVRVRVDSIQDDDFGGIGGDSNKTIQAGGTAGTGIIKGTANDGLKESSAENFAEFTLMAHPPLNAPAGTIDFKMRVSYFYT